MAITGILPSYQRFLNGAPVPNSTRRSFRPREKYLILLVFLTFGVVCFGAFFFLPEFRGGGTVNSVYKVYQNIQKAGPDLLIPAPPHGEESSETPGKIGLLRHDFEEQSDPHKIEDKAKLFAKIEKDNEIDRKNQKVLERPDIGLGPKISVSSSTKTAELVKQIENVVDLAELIPKIVTVPPVESDHYPVLTGGEDQDPIARARRNTVKEVRIYN